MENRSKGKKVTVDRCINKGAADTTNISLAFEPREWILPRGNWGMQAPICLLSWDVAPPPPPGLRRQDRPQRETVLLGLEPRAGLLIPTGQVTSTVLVTY